VATAAEDGLRFVPSAVEGLPAVTEAVVFPDRLELLSDGKRVVIRFLDIAQWHRLGWLYRPLARLGFRVQGWHSGAPTQRNLSRETPVVRAVVGVRSLRATPFYRLPLYLLVF
jgi:hypothetical protein